MNEEKNSFEAEQLRKFDRAAQDGGEDYEVATWTRVGLDAYKKYFQEYFKFSGSEVVLDAGCGPGTFSEIVCKNGAKVTAVDYSEKMIETARDRHPMDGIEYSVASIYELPFEDESFDAVVCLGVFQTLADTTAAVKELRRVLKKDGRLIIHTLNRYSLFSLLKGKKDPAIIRYDPYLMKKVFMGAGFHDNGIFGVYILPDKLGAITDLIVSWKLYKLLNLLFPVFMFVSHGFYLSGKKS